MTHDSGPVVFVVKKLRQEHVDRGAKRVHCEITEVLCKGEEREPYTESEMGKGRLRKVRESISLMRFSNMLRTTHVDRYPRYEH